MRRYAIRDSRLPPIRAHLLQRGIPILPTAYDRLMANARRLSPAGKAAIAVDLLTDVASNPLPGLIALALQSIC
jgi:hypothetical protein